MIVTILSALATCIGMTQACALLDQTRKLRRAGSAQEVSVMFLLASLVGNVVWFAYGALRVDPALLVVNSAGLIGGGATLITAVRLRRRTRPAALAMGPGSPLRHVDRRRGPSRRDVVEPSGSRNVLESQRRTCRMAAGQLPAARFQNAPDARATARAWAAQAGSGATPRTPAPGAVSATRDARPRMRRTCTTAPAR
ncbi:SemiSWEET family transporter [Actinopolymorpha pittospori]